MGPMSGSGTSLRPRYGRIAALVAATSTTLVALVGTLLTSHTDDAEESSPAPAMALSGGGQSASPSQAASPSTDASRVLGLPPGVTIPKPAVAADAPEAEAEAASPTSSTPPTLPRGSVDGRRVVFSEGQQRVWLVAADGDVARTYLVSGSVYDNLDPGSYEVYSHSRTATGIDGSDLRYMVRFTQGENAAIGFHSIPHMDGQPMQTREELGTPLSHGCIRQALPDAKALWRFAPLGTTVVVTD